MKIRCEHCRGSGSIEVSDAELPCDAEIVIGHETIGCFASCQHPGVPHMAILCEPCVMCGGFDECHETCGVYPMKPPPKAVNGWWYWNDSDLTVTHATEEAGQAWRDVFQPTSPWATHNRKAVA